MNPWGKEGPKGQGGSKEGPKPPSEAVAPVAQEAEWAEGDADEGDGDGGVAGRCGG